ncbi:MAG TPA: GNAT family N-acetyltransferase [Candidatus Agrococcus pullicola]|uniref:GNAT family N-acetyltransferase n=1 Tax=Candidatus Agrococcus pullicola TaxID=2838429 RepID=A0A9D1YZN4_9MICO|nr:GNAT family N-acetyltransferase [Candidatus Agrococcus pullicola]
MSADFESSKDALAYGTALLRGDRIRLVQAEETHLQQLAQWWQSPEWATLQQDVVRPQPVSQTVEQFRAWSKNDGPGSAGFAIIAEDELVGHITLWGITPRERIGTLAIIIGPDHVGQGYGPEATNLMIDYGFLELGLNKIELQVWAFNDRAIRAYERSGFVREGVRRAATFHDGRFHDQVLMGMLAQEFFARRG